MITPETIATTMSDDQVRAWRSEFPKLFPEDLSRIAAARIVHGLLCESCAPQEPDPGVVPNHVMGHICVPSHGWVACIHCEGSGLNASTRKLQAALRQLKEAEREFREAQDELLAAEHEELFPL